MARPKNEDGTEKKTFTFKCDQYPYLKFEPKKGIFEKFSSGEFKTADEDVAEYLRNYKGINIKEVK